MALILNIETSTKVCSIALAKDGHCIECVEAHGGQNYIHSEQLTVYIEELFRKSTYSLQQLDAVCVAKGPGSYTGLRIGVSCAKALCYALNIPLLSIDALDVLAAYFCQTHSVSKGDFLHPMIDARRMEVYTKNIQFDTENSSEISALIIDEPFLNSFKYKVFMFGDGANKVPLDVNAKHIEVVPSFETSAKGMVKIAEQKFSKNAFEDVAYFEPFYLKEFVTTVARKK